MKPNGFESEPLKFAALMAHQMQSPLNAVSTLLQSVLSEYAGPLLPTQRNALEKANSRCQQAVTSVRRMLAIIQAQADAARAGRFAALLPVLRQVHAQFVPEAAEHAIALQLEASVEPGFVGLDEDSLGEVVGALVGNALKYTPDHGRVRITIDRGTEPERVRVIVSDSGAGVPEKDREHIFEPFFRTPAARDSARPGVGLGLALVNSVVTTAGGTVTVDASEFGGAEFTIELPQVPEPEPSAEDAARGPALRVLIVGGVAAGPKAAAKIIRTVPDADVTIVDRGTVLSYAGCGLPHYVSGLVTDQRRLISSPAGTVRDPVFFRSVKNVHVLNRTEALEIDRAGKRVRVRDCVTGRESWRPYDRLLLATGAAPNVPVTLRTDLENVFTLHGVRDAEGIRARLAENRARDIAVVGGGLLGIEMTQAFASRGARVTILEKRAHVLPMFDDDIAALLELHLEANGVKVLTHTKATALHGRGRVSEVVTDRGAYPADMVILAVGVHPSVQLARDAGLALGETGAIAVDPNQRTSDPDIFAAGDCVETRHLLTGRPFYFPLGSTATKQGRVAAVCLCGGEDTFPGVMASCICRVFDYNVARTGLGEAEAAANGHDVLTVYAPGPDREHFMPDAALLLIKLVVDRATRRLLGVQATGRGGADKRVDVASMAIRAGWTVDELAEADLCYAPQYAPAMDNLITAANVARNKLDGTLRTIAPDEVHRLLAERGELLLLDVRTPEEHERVRLPHATLAPLGSLRERAAELPRDRLIVTFCDIGLRAYEASLILRRAGFENVRTLDGGLAMWPYEKLE